MMSIGAHRVKVLTLMNGKPGHPTTETRTVYLHKKNNTHHVNWMGGKREVSLRRDEEGTYFDLVIEVRSVPMHRLADAVQSIK